jgi:hypothetical protein
MEERTGLTKGTGRKRDGSTVQYRKLETCISRNEIAQPHSQFLHSSTFNVETGRETIIILFGNDEAAVSSGNTVHKSDPDIYIGFSSALHLLCG